MAINPTGNSAEARSRIKWAQEANVGGSMPKRKQHRRQQLDGDARSRSVMMARLRAEKIALGERIGPEDF